MGQFSFLREAVMDLRGMNRWLESSVEVLETNTG
jgi:hypothetical protein